MAEVTLQAPILTGGVQFCSLWSIKAEGGGGGGWCLQQSVVKRQGTPWTGGQSITENTKPHTANNHVHRLITYRQFRVTN